NTTDSRIAIARYDSLGTTDTAYGSAGLSAPALGPATEGGGGLVLQPDGKAVVSGTGSSSFVVARFNTSGTLDSSFGSSGWNSLDVEGDGQNPEYAVGLQSIAPNAGKIVLAGSSWAVPSPTSSLAEMARFKTDGAIDSGKDGFGQ